MDFWNIGSIPGCFCRGLRERERNTLQKLKLRTFKECDAALDLYVRARWGTVPLRG